MQLRLLKKHSILSYALPEKCEGQYWITQVNDSGHEERIISVEGIDGNWVLKSNKKAFLEDKNNRKIKDIILEPLSFYTINNQRSNEKILLYSEPTSEDRRHFTKLLIPPRGRLLIGRSENCTISYANQFTSSEHAELLIDDGSIKLNDLNSTNGTFANGSRVSSVVMNPGDMIYILGLEIIVGNGFIAMNNPDGKVNWDKSLKKLPKAEPVLDGTEQVDDDESLEEDLFYRSPRFKRDIKKAEFKIDPPTPLGNLEEIPLALMLGPSITMGMASLFTGLLAIQNVKRNNGDIMQAMPTLVMSLSMLIGMVLWPILTKRYEKKRRIEREKIRQEKYRNYLEQVRKEIANECVHQSQILHENHVTLDECVSRVVTRQRNLWERTIGQNDFLKLRLGLGTIPLEADIKYPERKFTIEEDDLQEELFKLADEPKVLENVPITLSLKENFISGIIGNRNSVVDMVKGLIIQLAALHSYDELKLAFIYDQHDIRTWDFVKWFPHTWDTGKSIRFIATNPNEVKELSAVLEKEIVKRQEIRNDEDLKEITPHYVIFAISKPLASKADVVDSILQLKKNYGLSLVTLYDELKNLPKECSMVVELDGNNSKIYDKNDISGKYVTFRPDLYLRQDVEELAISLANIHLNTSSSYNLPNMMTFLEMFGVGKIEHLNSLTRWRENNPVLTLETPIGIDTTGELFKLDLHEKFHGPHGLIAGMTGSGKSEFIMTFILSLAVNFDPNEVAFILIDYKGGGMANAFTHLPHLAGTITNLDGAAVNRSLVSIQSELKRRQAIFSEASKMLNTSNIDIYQYQKLFREGAVYEPLQHLFIISDEFAELKTQQPEFMEQLVSAARIGRSLGVHLILATQKPSGVVDDQIWSNSRFRICLKVQEKADSMDVIKRPDAAELTVTGRFFAQVGFNELFELGQSAWCGAPYQPVDRIEKKKDDSVVIIDHLGRVVKQVRPERRLLVEKPPKQIDEINKYLAKLAREENIRVRPLWLEPIPEMILVDELKRKYHVPEPINNHLDPVIGEVDDPENQRQMVMTLPLTQEGNVVIYGSAGSGKTTFITTLIYSLIQDHTPSEINIYILDFGSETLRSFARAPQVGDVLVSHENEKINNLFKMLNREIQRRKKLFSDYGGDYQSYLRASKQEMEAVIVIIHNYSAFTETYDDKEETIAYLTREGLKYGIYFILTALNTNAVRFRILQNFKQLYVLQLNDQSDYSGVLGSIGGVYPSKFKGRGIFKREKTYEFQIARIISDIEGVQEYIRSYCNEHLGKWPGAPAKYIPILPDKIDVQYLARDIASSQGNKIPVGIEKNGLNISYFNFENSYVTLVLSQMNEYSDFAQGLAEIINAKTKSDVTVLDPEGQFADDEARQYDYYDKDFNSAISSIFNTVVFRHNTTKDAQQQNNEVPEFEKLTCIISSLSALMIQISEDARDKFRLIMEKGETSFNIRFIIVDTVSNISAFAYESWFKAKVSVNDGIWLGNGISDQYQLKLAKITNDLYKDIGEDSGYVVSKGKPVLIKILSSVTRETEVEA